MTSTNVSLFKINLKHLFLWYKKINKKFQSGTIFQQVFGKRKKKKKVCWTHYKHKNNSPPNVFGTKHYLWQELHIA